MINKKCTENQTRNIIRYAATPTDDRKNKIMNLLNQIQHNRSGVINGFGLSIAGDFTKVPARQLEAPGIQYGQNRIVQPSRGVWNIDRQQFLQPINDSCVPWSIINTNFRTGMNELQELAEMVSF